MARDRQDCVRELAPGKVNLCLNVGSRLASGYHLLSSIICPIELSDDVEVHLLHQTTKISVHCELTPNLEKHVVFGERQDRGITAILSSLSTTENIAARAAALFLQELNLGSSVGLEIRLSKRIPFQAGLGGGSADAAAVLRALVHLLANKGANDKLALRVAMNLGSDISALLLKRILSMRGTGNNLSELQGPGLRDLCTLLAEYEVAIVKPCCGVSTAAAYAMLGRPLLVEHSTASVDDFPWTAFGVMEGCVAETIDVAQKNRLTFDGQDGSSGKPDSITRARDVLQSFTNDFEPVVFANYPQVAEAARLLTEAGAQKVVLCGSGSAVVGFAEKDGGSFEMLETIVPEGWFVASTRLKPTA